MTMKNIRLISLCLALALLIGMLPGPAPVTAAEAAKIKVSLTLTDSFAINFKISSDAFAASGFDRVEYYHENALLGTVSTCPEPDSSGMYVFSYTDIAPNELDYTVTAKLYANGLELSQAASVAAYCKAVLNYSEVYGEKLSVLVMELLNYGAAAQKYTDAAIADDALVNYGVAEAYPEIAALCGSDPLVYDSVQHIGSEITNALAAWTGVGLYLEDSISIRYRFRLQSPVLWGSLAELDFEGTECPMDAFNANYPSGDLGTPGHDSSQALRLDNTERSRYSATITMEAGYYRVSGFVRLGEANPATVSVTVWAYTGTSTGNSTELRLSDCIIGDVDENGWSYFEAHFNHKAQYSTLQFVLNNHNGSGQTVYFDNVKYEQYLLEGDPAEYVAPENPTEGLYLLAECGGKTWQVSDIRSTDTENVYCAYFDGLNPAQMRNTVVVTLRDSSGKTVSQSLAYSIESYVYSVCGNAGYSDTLRSLVEAMLRYGDATENWARTWTELVALDLEDAAIGDIPLVQQGSDSLGDLCTPGYGSSQSLRLDNGERAKYVATPTMQAGNYRISGYVYLNGAEPSQVSLTIWVMGETAASAISFSLANDAASVASTAVDGWHYFTVDFAHQSGYNTLAFVVNNTGGSGKTVYFDNLKYEHNLTPDGNSGPEIEPDAPEEPEMEDVWTSVISFDFESGPAGFVVNETESAIGVTTLNGDQALQVDAGVRAAYLYPEPITLVKGDYKFCGYVKLVSDSTGASVDPAVSSISVTIWKNYATEGVVNITTPMLKDSIHGDPDDNGWYYFEMPFDHAASYSTLKFILNNYDSGITAYFDDLQYMRLLPTNEALAAKRAEEWAQRLETEEVDSMMVETLLDDPYAERTAIGDNLIKLGSFNAIYETIFLENGTKKNDYLYWKAGSGTGITSKITTDGVFRVDASPENSVRVGTGIYQSVAVEPGAIYQIKLRYRIAPSNTEDHTWYGPFVSISSANENITLRAFAAPGGLNTGSEWTEFTQTFAVSDLTTQVAVSPSVWLYPGDWCEIDDIQLYKVGEPFKMELDVLTKFYYTDMERAVFTANTDVGAQVKFEVFDGKTSQWSRVAAISGGKASVEFDLSGMEKQGVPYVLRATLLDSDGNVLERASERVFIYDRPATLDTDGNYIKQTPNNEKLYFNAAYAILQEHYDEVQQIGSNVMSLSNAKSAEHVLGMLDFCEKYGYMGFLNMDWGLYNDNDIAKKRAIMIDVASNEAVQNHPAMLGYCLADEPWSWGSEADVAANLEEGYRLIREYDTKNIIFSVDNMPQYHENSTMYGDVLFVDHYDAPSGGKVYAKVKTAVDAANGRMPVWAVVNTYHNGTYLPTADQARNEIWQAFMAGAEGIGYYCISLAGLNAEGKTGPIWDVVDSDGNKIGQELWEGLASFKEKEWDIAFNRFSDGEGKLFREEIANDYMYSSWFDKNGELYMIILNLKGTDSIAVNIPLTSSDGSAVIGTYTATAISGGTGSISGTSGEFPVALAANQAVLYRIKPEPLAAFDFEDAVTAESGIIFPDNTAFTNKEGSMMTIVENTVHAGDKALKVEAKSRTQYSMVLDTNIEAGNYRLSGYVYLGNAGAENISVRIWSYKNTVSASGANYVTLQMSDCIVGEPGENGWNYFEMFFEHCEPYNTVQFILQNYDNEYPVYFDDISYERYYGEASLTQEPVN